jgi:hypothetical protein
MNYGLSGQPAGNRPVNPTTGQTNAQPFNFTALGGQVSNVGLNAGVGSNQYGDLPPWMNASGNMNYSGGNAGQIGPSAPMAPMNFSASAVSNPQTMAPGGSQMGGYIPGVNVPQYGSGMPMPGGPQGPNIQGGGPFSIVSPMDPSLSTQLGQYLSNNAFRGVQPFNLQTQLPFGMGMTQPGQLNAPTNAILNNLFQGFNTGNFGNIPGGNTLTTIANQGISALPEWQDMVKAMGQNIAQQQAQLGEQFGSMGGLAGTPFAGAMSQFQQGTTAQQNALLGQLQQQNILQGQIPVAEGLMSGAMGMGQYAQGLAQQDIQNVYSEFLRDQPQNNPLLQMALQMGTTFPPTLQRPGGTGLLAGILGGLPNFNVGGSSQTASTFTG